MRLSKSVLTFVMLAFLTVACYAQMPEWLWATSAGSSEDNEWCDDMVVSPNGDKYIAGRYTNNMQLGQFSLIHQGESSVFVAKIGIDGNYLWVHQYHAESLTVLLALDQNENLIVTGNFAGSLSIGDVTYVSSNFNIFVAKYSLSGVLQWVNKTTGGGGYVYDHAVQMNGDICLTGRFGPSLTFGATTIPASTLNGNDDMFVAKISSAGTWLWARNGNHNFSKSGNGVTIDSSNEIYVTGRVYNRGTPQRAYVTKYDSYGNILWDKQFGSAAGTAGAEGKYIIYHEGFLYSAGVYSGGMGYNIPWMDNHGFNDAYITKLDLLGNWVWARSVGGPNYDSCPSLALDSESSLYLTSGFNSLINIGATTHTPISQADVYVAKLDSGGDWVYSFTSGTSGNASSSAIAVMGSDIYICGAFNQELPLPCGSLSSLGGLDIFIAKLGYYPISASFTIDDSFGGYPHTVNFSDTSYGGNGLIIEWFWEFGDGSISYEQNPTHIYHSRGTYSPSLTITNSKDSTSVFTATGSILVVYPSPFMEVSPISVNFPGTSIGEFSEQSVTLKNMGESDLELFAASFNTEFFELMLDLPISIPYGIDQVVPIRFNPSFVGSISDTLTIVNNSSNQPLIMIRLSGVGMEVPPMPPQNVTAQIDGFNCVISWDAVSENENNQAITPDFYFVYTKSSGSDSAPLTFLGLSTGTEFIHYGATLGADRMLYAVKSVVFYREAGVADRNNTIKSIPALIQKGMTEADVSVILEGVGLTASGL